MQIEVEHGGMAADAVRLHMGAVRGVCDRGQSRESAERCARGSFAECFISFRLYTAQQSESTTVSASTAFMVVAG
jgi:hypothetical protein